MVTKGCNLHVLLCGADRTKLTEIAASLGVSLGEVVRQLIRLAHKESLLTSVAGRAKTDFIPDPEPEEDSTNDCGESL